MGRGAQSPSGNTSSMTLEMHRWKHCKSWIAHKDYDLAFRETPPPVPAPEDESTSTDSSMVRGLTSE